MTTVALVTGSSHLSFVDRVDAPLVAALQARGVTVEQPAWHDPSVDWAAFDLAFVRTTWDYTTRRDEFVAWARTAGAATRVMNPPDVLRWNTHKSYLIELEERGAPVVPTAWLGRGDQVGLAALLHERGWPRAVVKPAVAAGSDGLVRVALASGDGSAAGQAPGPAAEAGPSEARFLDADAGQHHLDDLLTTGDVMVQPYLERVVSAGELSVIVVAGRVSHAVRKEPVPGDFRVQEEFGGRFTAVDPDADTRALAEWVVEATGHRLLVARVDLLAGEDGTWNLAELEATEPDLYLTVVPEAAEVLADAVVAAAAAPVADA